MIPILYLVIAVALLFLNAFFVAAEFAMVKLRYTQIEPLKENYGLRGNILAEVHQHLDVYLSACQLGITLASLGLGWVGEPAMASLLHPLFDLLNITTPELAKLVAFSIAFLILSFLHIVIGELMPKSLAIRQPESISLWTAIPLYGFYWLMFPAIWVLNACSNFMLRITNLDKIRHGEHFYSNEEIKLILNVSHLHGELSREEAEMIEHVFDLADLKVTEVMRPREEMIVLDVAQPLTEVLQIVTTHRYSRYPIYDKNEEDIIGILHVKDLFSAIYQDPTFSDLRSLVRPVLKVFHRLPAINLLRKFRKGMPHFALIYSQRKILIGFVTMDNLLHVLIGRIKDEYHRTKEDWVREEDGTITAKGDCSIYSLERALDIDIEVPEEVDTLTGLIFHRLGTIPNEGVRLDLEEFSAMIVERDGPRIKTVRIYPLPESKDQ